MPEEGAVAEHRDRFGDALRPGAEPAESREERVQHRGRDELRDALDGGGRRRHTVGVQRPRELPGQERVPAAHPRAGRDELRLGFRQLLGHERADRRLAQRGRLDEHGALRVTQGAQRVAGRHGLAGPHRHDDGHRQAVESDREVREERHRRPVRPLGVVDDDRERPVPAGEVDRQPVQPADERGKVRRRRARGVEQQARMGRLSVEEPVPLRRRRPGQPRCEELDRHAERRLALELERPGLMHVHPRVARLLRRGGEQPRLPDPRRPLDEHQLARAPLRRRQGRGQGGELPVPLEQPCACAGHPPES
jgi:hypothetical protein